MLFQKFIFVLYILFCYAWFLLGTLYETDYRFIPIVSMITSLSSISIITLFQLQSMFAQHRISDNDKWSTLSWSAFHIFIGMLFIIDGLEWANVVVIFCIAGLAMTFVIFVVGTCSCHVIINNGKTWYPHVHLTCVGFWTLIQYMFIRTPTTAVYAITSIPITSVPIVCMAITRAAEHLEDIEIDKRQSIGEGFLWCVCIFIHVLRDLNIIDPKFFYWGSALSILVLCFISTYAKELTLVIILPLLLLPFAIYISIVKCLNGKIDHAITEIKTLYKDIMITNADLIMIPFEEEFNEEDWSEKL